MIATRTLMTLGALLMGLVGLAATFMPQEILALAGVPAQAPAVLAVQVGGALYLGFAILDWMSRGSLIGGIYGRPVALANLCHFLIAALALLKAVGAGERSAAIVVAAVVYALLAVAFALVVFRHPLAADPAPEKAR